MSINLYVIRGNVARDLELRYTANGTPVTTFTVAVNDVWYDAKGAKQDDCDYIPVTTFGVQAENDARYLVRGSPVAVTGRIRSWYAKDSKKSGFKFEATQVDYIGSIHRSTQSPDHQPAPSGSNPDHEAWLAEYDGEQSHTPRGGA